MTDSRETHQNAIDLRHRNWIESVLMSGLFRRVLEIGSYEGFSTEAFWTALNAGAVDEVHICEPFPTPDLEAALRFHSIDNPNGVFLRRCRSVDLLSVDVGFPFVFVDGLHSTENVMAELRLLLPSKTIGVICFHDTGAAGRYVGCDGPQFAKAAYQKEGWLCIEDSLFRDGERTERGLTMACRTPDIYDVVLSAYRQCC